MPCLPREAAGRITAWRTPLIPLPSPSLLHGLLPGERARRERLNGIGRRIARSEMGRPYRSDRRLFAYTAETGLYQFQENVYPQIQDTEKDGRKQVIYWPARTSKKLPRRTASKRKSSTQITLNAAEEMLLFACWNCDFDG